MTPEKTPEELIVQKQLDTYNVRDLDLFSVLLYQRTWIFNFENKTAAISWIENLWEIYIEIFDNSPNLNATIKPESFLIIKSLMKRKSLEKTEVNTLKWSRSTKSNRI